jgi:hypothetical protein
MKMVPLFHRDDMTALAVTDPAGNTLRFVQWPR